MKRRTAITAIPLAIAGFTAAAKGNLRPVGLIPTNKGVLDERELSYAISMIADASGSGIFCTFVAFAHHISTLAAAGENEQIRAAAESLIDDLRRDRLEFLDYDEPRERWLEVETADLKDACDMDDPRLPEYLRDRAMQSSNARHEHRAKRRNGGAA